MNEKQPKNTGNLLIRIVAIIIGLIATLFSFWITFTGVATACPKNMVFFSKEINFFCLDLYEVTNRKYKECVDEGVCTEPDKTASVTRMDELYYGNPTYGNYPVIRVTWYQADQYCQYVGKRLPTATEWDIAAHTPDYYDSWPSLEELILKYKDTQAVGSTGDVSPEGVHNLGDNVREWVADPDKRKPSERVVKGQSFYSYATELNSYPPSSRDWGMGIRCAADS